MVNNIFFYVHINKAFSSRFCVSAILCFWITTLERLIYLHINEYITYWPLQKISILRQKHSQIKQKQTQFQTDWKNQNWKT